MKQPILYIVIPCYNEQEVLPVTAPLFLAELQDLIAKEKIDENSRILFVNDGSKDDTWEIIRQLSTENRHFQGIAQSRNRGHQNAVLAGLMEAMPNCDITISIDCDGQDDILVMEQMVDAYLDGCDIVYGVRAQRKTDTFFKRFTALSFYKLLNCMGAEVVYNHADYRLVSSRALQAFSSFEEVNLFLRGMFPLVGFRSTSVFYDRHERLAGKTHYPLRKMIGLAVDGITSLSVKPIHIITGLGSGMLFAGVIAGICLLIRGILRLPNPSWVILLFACCLFTGIQLIGLGIVGEYVGKTYIETKRRPRYIISERTTDQV